jgi:simple sugar transport system ATP-binding protein
MFLDINENHVKQSKLVKNPNCLSNVNTKIMCEAKNIYKHFGATQALNGVSIKVLDSEIHGLVGKNGAGKSTLVGILTGLIVPDNGEVFFQTKPAPRPTDRSAWRKIVGCVYQKPTIVPTLSVAENLFLGNLPINSNGFLQVKKMKKMAHEALLEWNIDIDIDIKASELTANHRNLVEIIRALLLGARFIILDEPTAGLEAREISMLFDRIHSLQASGVSFIYISHHLEEVFEICQKVTIFRDGQVVTSKDIGNLSRQEMIFAMMGEKKSQPHIKKEILNQLSPQLTEQKSALLDVQCLTVDNLCEDINFQIFSGECVGLVGHKGSGITAVADSIAGLTQYKSGIIKLDSNIIPKGRPDKAIKEGVGYVPEDRYVRGFIGCRSIADNIMLPVLRRFSRLGILSLAEQCNETKKLVKALNIKVASVNQHLNELSGGNQQKVTLARALSSNPKLYVLVEPTLGVDVTAKELILNSIQEIRNKGRAVLLVSDDVEDLWVCDRIIVMFKGHIFKIINKGWKAHDIVMAIEGWNSEDHIKEKEDKQEVQGVIYGK